MSMYVKNVTIAPGLPYSTKDQLPLSGQQHKSQPSTHQYSASRTSPVHPAVCRWDNWLDLYTCDEYNYWRCAPRFTVCRAIPPVTCIGNPLSLHANNFHRGIKWDLIWRITHRRLMLGWISGAVYTRHTAAPGKVVPFAGCPDG